MKWPAKQLYKSSIRRPSQLTDKRVKWQYQCQDCQEWFKEKEGEYDHIVPCGPLTNEDHIQHFFFTLFCEPTNYQFLCVPCHLNKTNKQKKGK